MPRDVYSKLSVACCWRYLVSSQSTPLPKGWPDWRKGVGWQKINSTEDITMLTHWLVRRKKPFKLNTFFFVADSADGLQLSAFTTKTPRVSKYSTKSPSVSASSVWSDPLQFTSSVNCCCCRHPRWTMMRLLRFIASMPQTASPAFWCRWTGW